MLKTVVNSRPDGKFVASLEDRRGNVLWGPSVFDQQDAALRAAKANLDRILRFAGKPK